MAVPKPMLSEFGIHHRLESCGSIIMTYCLRATMCTVVVIFLLQCRVRLRMVGLNAIAIARFNSPNA